MVVPSNGRISTGFRPSRLRTELDVAIEVEHHVTGQEACNDATEEAGADGAGNHASDGARRDAGAVGNRIGDEAGKDRYHQREGLLADVEQRLTERTGVRVIVNVDATEGEG